MKLLRTFSLGMIVVITVLAAPITASAQYLEIDPISYDFGDVVIGQEASMIFTLSHTGLVGDPIDFNSIEIIEESNPGVFTITSDVPPPPIPIDPPGSIGTPDPDFLDVTVVYSPTAEGPDNCKLRVISNAPTNYLIDIPISGVGVLDEPEPSEVMANLIVFFNTSVADGSIEGYGPGSSAAGRLRAFGNMLDAADNLIVSGDYETACEQLNSAYGKVDGEDNPPDFIANSDEKETLATMIMAVLDALGCP